MIFFNDKKFYWKRLREKKGASLPMVIIIGLALVIFAMALLPLMTTSGTTAVKTAVMEQDYLNERSAVEFVKSELLYFLKVCGDSA